MEKCSDCGELKIVVKRNQDGTPLCQFCHKEICSNCGKLKQIFKRNKDGTALCPNCYEKIRPKKVCSSCGKLKKIVKTNQDGTTLCPNCYEKTRPKKVCSSCGELKIISKRNEDGTILCKNCYNRNRPKKVCSGCGELKKIVKRKQDGTTLCQFCYREVCSSCGILKKVKTRNHDGTALCTGCYSKYRKKIDYKYYLKSKLRARLRDAFKEYSKTGKINTSKEYGIDYNAIIEHLGPCPGEREEYHIDHIFPLSAFDFDNLGHIKVAFAPENHQWLSKEDNLKKSDKYNKKEFNIFLKKFGIKINILYKR
jgi:hypothetical protein